MAALRMARLWEARLSNTSTSTAPSDDDEDPVQLDDEPARDPFRPQRRRPSSRRKRPDVSANKPPVPPPLASGAGVLYVEEEPVSEATLLEAMSPVSSFLSSSAVRSPPPSPGFERAGAAWVPPFCEEVRGLREELESWEERFRDIERRQRELSKRLEEME